MSDWLPKRSEASTKAKEAAWFDETVYVVGVANNGLSRTEYDLYAEYVCQLLHVQQKDKHQLVLVYDSARLRNNEWMELGEASCELVGNDQQVRLSPPTQRDRTVESLLRVVPETKGTAWLSPRILVVRVTDNGSNRDEYATRVCDVFKASGSVDHYKRRSLAAHAFDHEKLARGVWHRLGKAACKK